jgi:hypothetical protein
MKLIQPTDFCKINEILMDKAIFIIPNFQRPYVWGERQFKDLFNDLEKAAQNNGFHYLSAIHVLELQPADWSNLIDDNNEDCQKLKDNNADLFGNPIPIYAVVDGQQRLTTVFLLAHVLAKMQQQLMLLQNLSAPLQSRLSVPRLIQSPTDDHLYMQKMLANYHAGSNLAKPQSAAQRRLKEGLVLTDDWAKQNNNAISYLLNKDLQTSVIRLETNYGLTSFLTLNDRGKPLTVLERLKAVILQAVFESGVNTTTASANKWHSAFGRIYKILDKLCHIKLFRDGEEGDQEMVKLFSCYLRLQTDAKSIWQSGDAAYDEFFRATLADVNTNIPTTLANWLKAIEEVGEGLEHLHDCLTNSSNASSIIFPNNGTLVDDYKAIFLSLGLQPHLFALLLKFRALTKQSWHIPYPINAVPPTTLIKIIQNHVQEVRQKAQAASAHAQILTYIDQLENQLRDIKPRDKLSMLEAVERLQILNWNLESRWYETFKKSCNTNLVIGNSAENIVGYWFQWCGGHDFLTNVLTRWNDPNFRYLLREMERGCGQYIHDNRDLQLEHILPQTPDDEPRFKTIGSYAAFDYTDKEEYSREGVWRSGNLTWLTESCNASLGNSMPDDKAAEYISCTKHSGGKLSGSSHIQITHKVGNELRPIQQDYKSYRWFISARCAELALFSIGRFI